MAKDGGSNNDCYWDYYCKSGLKISYIQYWIDILKAVPMRLLKHSSVGEISEFSILIIVVLVIFWTVSGVVIFLNTNTDYIGHLKIANKTISEGRIMSPHFLYEFLVIGTDKFFQFRSLKLSAQIVTTLSYCMLSIILYYGFLAANGIRKTSFSKAFRLFAVLGVM